MFKHILVPVSRVKEVRNALEIAANMTSGTVTLLHVIELVQDMSKEEFGEFYRTLESQVEEDLKTAEATYLDQGIDLRTKIIFGQRVRNILDYAEANGVDLILLQSHPIDLTDPTRGWGTISYRVAILAQCPVMLVK